MMRRTGAQSVDRALRLLTSILDGQGASGLTEIARREAIPSATAYRLVASLVRQELVVPASRGRYVASPRFLARLRTQSSLRILAALARPVLRKLARKTRSIAHLGILDNDMVTYLVREGQTPGSVFSREGGQLEAYCSGIGKVLLAALPEEERERYLENGPFVPLTSHTITDASDIRREIAAVCRAGLACDNEEFSIGVHCLAVPIGDSSLGRPAGISISRDRTFHIGNGRYRHFEDMMSAKRRIEDILGRMTADPAAHGGNGVERP